VNIVVEFYRTRNVADAHAVVGRETKEAVNTGDAIDVARQLSQTLDMPQRPEAMTITDANDATLYSGVIDAEADNNERLRRYHLNSPSAIFGIEAMA
jgi:hypothetical protein